MTIITSSYVVKVKFILEVLEGELSYSSTLSLTLALDGMGGQRHAPAALPPGKRPDIHFVGSWVGSSSGLDGCGKSRPPPGFDPRTIQPVASRYPDWAIPAHRHVLYSVVWWVAGRSELGVMNTILLGCDAVSMGELLLRFRRRIVLWSNVEGWENLVSVLD